MTQLSAGMDDMVGSIDFRVKEFKFDPRTCTYLLASVSSLTMQWSAFVPGAVGRGLSFVAISF